MKTNQVDTLDFDDQEDYIGSLEQKREYKSALWPINKEPFCGAKNGKKDG